MGSECRHIYNNNLGLTAGQQEDVAVILIELGKYFSPTKNVIFERYVFGNLKQEEGETIDAFVTRMREKAASCEYGGLRDELIRDRLVLGITDERARRRLLREKDLTLPSAVEICRAAEVMDSKLKALALDNSKPGESLNVADSQRPGRQFSGKQQEPTGRSKPAQSMLRACGAQASANTVAHKTGVGEINAQHLGNLVDPAALTIILQGCA